MDRALGKYQRTRTPSFESRAFEDFMCVLANIEFPSRGRGEEDRFVAMHIDGHLVKET